MTKQGNALIMVSARGMLALAVLFLFLFGMNVRSRILYHGPNYSFIGWMFIYSAITGVGLLKLKKWAVVLLFVPFVLFLAVFVVATIKNGFPMPWGIASVIFIGLMGAMPLVLLRYWKELQW